MAIDALAPITTTEKLVYVGKMPGAPGFCAAHVIERLPNSSEKESNIELAKDIAEWIRDGLLVTIEPLSECGEGFRVFSEWQKVREAEKALAANGSVPLGLPGLEEAAISAVAMRECPDGPATALKVYRVQVNFSVVTEMHVWAKDEKDAEEKAKEYAEYHEPDVHDFDREWESGFDYALALGEVDPDDAVEIINDDAAALATDDTQGGRG